jgi:ribosomal protein S18 acetylase RimI-like enzyme
MEYIYFKIDKDAPNLQTLAAKYRELRLEALQQSPTSFSSTYEIEEQFSDDVWTSRLLTANKETFICAALSGGGGGTTAAPEDCEWAGQVTMLGPVLSDVFALPTEAGEPAIGDDATEEKWQMLSLFTLPSHRGKGLGKKLCQEAFRFLVSPPNNEHQQPQQERATKVRVRIMIKPENWITVNLYRSLGFVDAGTCTLEEALRANGDAELLPSGPLSDTYTKRSGKIMLLELDRS